MEQLILENFLNRSFEELEYAITENLLSIEHLRNREPVVLLGIPILAIFECIVRSQYQNNEIILSSGHKLSNHNSPPLFKDIITIMIEASKILHQLNWSHIQIINFKKQTIHSMISNNDTISNSQLYSLLYKISIQITQTSHFKNRFENVLSLTERINDEQS